MSDFQYKYAWWDKARPVALKSTGLGKALKAYEAARAKFLSRPFTFNYQEARKALKTVEDLRAAAIKQCGTLFSGTKKALQGGVKATVEVAVLNKALETALEKEISGIDKSMDDLIESLQSRVKWANTMMDKIKKGTASDPELKNVDKVVHSESDAAVPGDSDLGNEYNELRRATAYFKKEVPTVMTVFENITKNKRPELARLRGDYLEALRELEETYDNRHKYKKK